MQKNLENIYYEIKNEYYCKIFNFILKYLKGSTLKQKINFFLYFFF